MFAEQCCFSELKLAEVKKWFMHIEIVHAFRFSCLCDEKLVDDINVC